MWVFQIASFVRPKDSTFILVNDEEKQQILKFTKVEPSNVWQFCLKIIETMNHYQKMYVNIF